MTSLRLTFKLLKRNPLSFVGIGILLIFIIIALLAPVIAPPPENHLDSYMIPRDGYSPVPQAPSSEHIFGTTEGQYDIYYGVIWGTRTAFQIGLLVTASVLALGVLLGSIAGYFGGIVDEIIMRITDIFLAFPALVLAMALTIALGPSITSVMIALVIVSWPSYARLIRGDILATREEDYVEAARGIGCSNLRIIVKHILPNAIGPIVVNVTLSTAMFILQEAALSFLGLGVPLNIATWGNIVNVAQDLRILQNFWWLWVPAAVIISLFVLAVNFIGDGLRDSTDPTQQG